jgi:hypothetical protein
MNANPPSTPAPHPRVLARLRRIAVIRRRVAAGALATFALAFGAITATGSTGSASVAATPAAATAATAATPPASASDTGYSSTPTTTNTAVAAVTTRQS